MFQIVYTEGFYNRAKLFVTTAQIVIGAVCSERKAVETCTMLSGLTSSGIFTYRECDTVPSEEQEPERFDGLS